MSLEEIEWTESEGDTDDNLALEEFSDDSENEHEVTREQAAGGSRGRRTRDEELDPEVEIAYQDARGLYTSGDHEGALVLLEEAVRHEAGSKLLYNLLVTIHEERNDFEKALLARIAVAHLDKRDKDTWIEIAERSEQLGHLGQAALFFQHVSRIDKGNWIWLHRRADLHLQLGEATTALTLLQRIRVKFFPRGPEVGLDHKEKTQLLLSIAGVLKDLGRVDEATMIYLDIYNRSLNSGLSINAPAPEVDLDWQNLNVLCELLMDQKLYPQIVTTVKNGARWILGRGDEVFWQQFSQSTDAEFDSRRESLLAKLTPAQQRQVRDRDRDEQYDLPIDIRIWLLESRLKMIPTHLLLNAQNIAAIESLPTVEDALAHMAELREWQPVEAYSDLYRRGASAFFEARLYSEARELYIYLTGIAHETVEEYLDMTVQVAKCEMELHNIERAEHLYSFVLERDPRNQEALIAMGEIFAATNRQAESRAVLLQFENVRTQSATSGSSAVSVSDPAVSRDTPGAGNIFVGSQRPKAPSAKPSRAERAEIERNAQARADMAFSGLARFQSGLDSGNEVATTEWLRYADELVDMFASHRKFFPADRQKDFFSFEGSSNTSVDQRIARLRLAQEDQAQYPDREDEDEDASLGEAGDGLADGDSSDADDEDDDKLIDTRLRVPKRRRPSPAAAAKRAVPSRGELEESYIWRGQPLSTWFLVLMQSALVHAGCGHGERAQKIVMIAQAANIFSLNAEHSDTMHFVALSCAYISKDVNLVGDLLRHMQTQYQFNKVTFQLYVALLARGKPELAIFGSSNNQKFFLRQIKALDSVVHHRRPVVGMAKVVDPSTAPTSDDPQLLMLYVYIMLLGPSFAPALTYLIRTRGVLPDHPLVLLVYGIVQMHRATQRTSMNRHLQLLEGLSYMQDYAEIRGPAGASAACIQETRYNLGRFFHGVGLLTLAVRYYEEVLALSPSVDAAYDMARDAAYNLHLIYAENGNAKLSASVVEQYLVI